jgi:hypothetical protein
MKVATYVRIAIGVALALVAGYGNAQAGSGGLRGQVADPSGAAVTAAAVVLTPANGGPINAQTNSQGAYEFKGLAPGKYTLNVIADGFATYENIDVEIAADQIQRVNVALTIAVEEQKVQVSDTTPLVDVNPANNASAVVISGKELEALPDDPDELLTDLQALAGPSAGPNGGQLYIDGFTAGQLPPKSSIREIRINQNPFSSEYDKLGYGRIEIFTKPGTDKFHGQLFVSGNSSAFNSSNPFAGPEPGYDSTQFSGNLSGPINKKASFFFTAERRNQGEVSAVNATIFDPVLGGVPFSDAVPNPRHRTNLGPRLDYQISKNNTLTARYQYFRNTEDNDGIGNLDLSSLAFNSESTEHTLQISDTQIIGANIINETRFQYLRELTSELPQNFGPAINVAGAFSNGGSGSGTSSDHQDHYELQNYTSVVHGTHVVKFGGRLRAVRDANLSTAGFNGTFLFSSLCSQDDFPTNAACVNLPPGVGMFQTGQPSQLSATTGLPSAEVSNFDAGLYAQDDWRIRPNLTLSYGLRFETQTGIADHVDLAPRFGLAWGIGPKGSAPKTVVRAGFGIFYDRFGESQILQAERLNGVTQQQFNISDPANCFPDVALCLAGSTPTSSTIYRIDPGLRSPYTVQSALSLERQVGKIATLAANYLNSRGYDQLLSLVLPNPSGGNIYQYSSEGVFKQNQLIVNTNVRAGTKVQLFGYYVLNFANSDTAGVSSFPSDSNNISADYGRSTFDVRDRAFFGGSLSLPYAIRLSPFMVASSGSPFNITTPDDLNGDSIFNNRPVFASNATCPVVSNVSTTYCTPLGTFVDALPGAGQRVVPINFGTGPAHFTLNLRLSKTFGFGPKVTGSGGVNNNGGGGPPGGGGGGGRGGGGGGGGGGFGGPRGGPGGPMGGVGATTNRRYSLTLSASARNVFNKVNTANPISVLGSPLFDRPNALQGGPFSTGAANRRIDLQATFSF